MSKAGEVYENPVTGERAVLRIGTGTTGGERLVVDLYVQPAVFARELPDVMRFTRPPRIVRANLFGHLTPLARLLGYRGSCSKYLTCEPSSNIAVEPIPSSRNDTQPSTKSQSGR